jgi:adenosylcobinamide kinase / adenosylcobinamide-phosphate guanylyltransferase
MRTFLLGGARSGKSSLAARLAAERSNDVCCVVTAVISDNEMKARIDAHRRERPQHWRTREEPVKLSLALQEESAPGRVVLIDCLTLWTANCLWPPAPVPIDPNAVIEPDIAGWHAERDAFLASLAATRHDIIIVSNEVGTSLVPENAAARIFRDEQGRLNQLVAVACDSAFLVAAGLPLRLK